MIYIPELLLDRLDTAPVRATILSLDSGARSIIQSGSPT